MDWDSFIAGLIVGNIVTLIVYTFVLMCLAEIERTAQEGGDE